MHVHFAFGRRKSDVHESKGTITDFEIIQISSWKTIIIVIFLNKAKYNLAIMILDVIHHVLEEGNDQSEFMIWSYALANISFEDLREWASRYGHHSRVLPKLPILQVGVAYMHHTICIDVRLLIQLTFSSIIGVS